MKSGVSVLVAALLLLAVVATAVAGGLALGLIPPLGPAATATPSPTIAPSPSPTPSPTPSPSPSPSPTAEPSPSPSESPTGDFIHVVQDGEFLSAIAELYGIDWTVIATANGLTDPYIIYPGDELIIPAAGASPSDDPCSLVYIVKEGDTFFDIAYQLDVSATELEAANPQVTSVDDIRAGDQLNVPRGAECPSPSPSAAP